MYITSWNWYDVNVIVALQDMTHNLVVVGWYFFFYHDDSYYSGTIIVAWESKQEIQVNTIRDCYAKIWHII